MVNYFKLVSDELIIKLNQTRQFIKKHNPTIGILTEEILRSFLQNYLPSSVSVEQGFIMSEKGEVSKQSDILIYDSIFYAPLYRINDIVVVPADSVIAVIEVKTTLNTSIFHNAIRYFENISSITRAKTYLFVYEACNITELGKYFHSFEHKGDYQQFDHDTFEYLPDEITGINNSYHLIKDNVVFERDMMGYSSYFFEDEEGTEINALQNFYISIYTLIEDYINVNRKQDESRIERGSYYERGELTRISAIGLFDM